MSVGNKIIYNFPRPAKELVEQFRGMPVANIDDNMGRIAAVDSAIVPINSSPLVGTAFTIRAPQGDNLMFHKAMDMAQPGDVIMIDAGGSVDRAIFGELMATYCRSRGIAGIHSFPTDRKASVGKSVVVKYVCRWKASDKILPDNRSVR